MAFSNIPGMTHHFNCRCATHLARPTVYALGLTERDACRIRLESAVLIGASEDRIDELLDAYNAATNEPVTMNMS